MIKKSILYFCAFLTCIYALTSCRVQDSSSVESTAPAIPGSNLFIDDSKEETEEETKSYLKAEIPEEHLYDNKELYKDQDNYSVITMYLTVSKGNTGDSSFHTWEEVNKYSAYDYANAGNTERYKVEGLLQIDETGDGLTEASFGYEETIPNVSVQVRGQSSSLGIQKNYKIRIKDGMGRFRGQRTLDLNKHLSDPYRFINKLSYDLANSVPEMIAGRTQFVHLYVKDTTVSDEVSNDINAESDSLAEIYGTSAEGEQSYIDYGLYTMVEQVNKTYLKTHGFDENGQLYKLSFFEWTIQDALMTDQEDPLFDQIQFDTFLESKANNDHEKLQSTIADLNNFSIPIDVIVEEHFDVENMMYFFAFNILIGNSDVGPRNLFLYSPLNSEKFYFICWDMDASFHVNYRKYRNYTDGSSWERGMTQYLGLVLMERMMKEEKYRNLLSDAVDDLYQNYITPEKVKNLALSYSEIVKPYVYSMPDTTYSKLKDPKVYDEFVASLGEEVSYSYDIYKESLKWPWPFFVSLPTIDLSKNETILSWDSSYNYGENVTYDYYLATDYEFENVLYEDHGLSAPMAKIECLAPGTYYLRVTSTGETGYTIDCFDYSVKKTGGKSYGCYCFIVKDDYTVVTYEEVKL